jgi:hypothetical protein
MQRANSKKHIILIITAAVLSLPVSPYCYGVTIEEVLGQVSQEQYTTYQQTIEDMGLGLYGGSGYNQGYRNRDGWSGEGSAGNQEARLYLSDKFAEMGLDVTMQGSYKNVVGELAGTGTPEKIYIVGAHYDTTNGGEKPGGDDNASGTAAILEAARVMSKYSFASTIRFIGFNAEEDGLKGSGDYVDNAAKAGSENIAGMISLDMILRPLWDNNSTQPADGDLVTNSAASCLAWADIFLDAASTYVPSLEMDEHSPSTSNWNSSDQGPFINGNFPAFGIFENIANEIWGGSNVYYHSSQDASDGAAGAMYDYLFATDIVRATVATLTQEAQLVPEPGTILLFCVGIAALRRKNKG